MTTASLASPFTADLRSGLAARATWLAAEDFIAVPRRRPRIDLVPALLTTGGMVFVAAVLAWTGLLVAGEPARGATATLGALAGAGSAAFNFGIVLLCLRELRRR